MTVVLLTMIVDQATFAIQATAVIALALRIPIAFAVLPVAVTPVVLLTMTVDQATFAIQVTVAIALAPQRLIVLAPAAPVLQEVAILDT